ncbi:hypothetical protein H0H92_005139 [Tricholoma furcatifolium]|nr:hypothetical protein H0H92_005139 [Tricholoma furcatifolium]
MVGSTHALKNSRVYYLAFVVYWGIILFGYDAGIAGGVVSQPYFQQEFKLRNPDGSKNRERTDEVTSLVVSVLQAGGFFGALTSSPISADLPVKARFGRKRTLLAFTLVFSLGACLATAALDHAHHGLSLIYAGRVVSGLGIGGISAVAPAFVSECSPKEVRGRITGLFQLMVAVGMALSYFVNFGISQYEITGSKVWRIPFGLQLVPAGIMLFGLFTVKARSVHAESPRYLASIGNTTEAAEILAYLRKESTDSPVVSREMAEIEAEAEEERVIWLQGKSGVWDALRSGDVRFGIAFGIFFLQQWGGQNSVRQYHSSFRIVSYYTPQVFERIGFTGANNSLLASESFGRRIPLFISSIGMGTLFFAIGTILGAYPPLFAFQVDTHIPTGSAIAMAILLYVYVCAYSIGWGPISWLYVAEIFPTRTRHHGLAVASASQWFWNFVVAKVTPYMISHLGNKIFFLFGTINLAAMTIFAFFLPETKGRSLEDMDVIFGAVSAEEHAQHVTSREEARLGGS